MNAQHAVSDTDIEAAGGVWHCPAHGGKHLHQATQYQQEKKTASTSGQTVAERAPAQSPHSKLNASYINIPSLAHHTRLLEAFRVKAVPRAIHHSGGHYPLTGSQYVPDKFALFIHTDLPPLRLPPKISPWTLSTSPVIQHPNV